MIRLVIAITLCLLVTGWLFIGETDQTIRVVNHDIAIEQNQNLRIALLADFHFSDDPGSFDYLESLLVEVSDRKPDLIALAGDYIVTREHNPKEHILEIVSRLSAFQDIAPTFAVLGNHDNWSGRSTWIEAFESSPITLIENDTRITGKQTCLRGLGDHSSGYYSAIGWPGECNGSLKITLTHDPYASFVDDGEGIFLAGHTHCGQIRLPLIGAPWTPTKAPPEAQCGLFSNDQMTLIVSGGLNTSLVPFRLGTTPHWNFLTINQRGFSSS